MEIINIQAAKTHLSRLVERAAAGEEIVIAKAGKPIVRLQAIGSQGAPRKLGLLAGKVRESADCWSPDEELEHLFYDGETIPLGPQRQIAEDAP